MTAEAVRPREQKGTRRGGGASQVPRLQVAFGNFVGSGFAAVVPTLTCAFTAVHGRLIATAGAAHVPSAIRRLDKTEFPRGCRIAEYLRVVGRINTVQAARPHIPALVFVVVLRPSRRSRTKNAQADGYRKRDEMLLSAH
jgi:hypothetical protein